MKLALLVSSSMLMGVSAANACSCIPTHGREILRSAEAVFRATATHVEYLEDDAKEEEPPILVTFEVHEVWKGPERSTALLRTVYNKRSCAGYYFKAGSEYLVAAVRVVSEGSPTEPPELAGIFLCGGTADVEGAGNDLGELGPGTQIDAN